MVTVHLQKLPVLIVHLDLNMFAMVPGVRKAAIHTSLIIKDRGIPGLWYMTRNEMPSTEYPYGDVKYYPYQG